MTPEKPDDEEMVVKKISLRVRTDRAVFDQVLSWFDTLNQPPTVDNRTWWQCQTVLKEGFDNVVDYAHKDLIPDTPIDIEAVRRKASIEIRIWDQGKPFDLKRKLAQMPTLDENYDGERGRGLRIMEKVADELSYDRTSDNRNCLVIIKQLTNENSLAAKAGN
ncbi:MAG: anti-sigma regulatory factor [Cyanobacteria bacterium]|nr:anti-sigma regulatory factor [Cyanobacteriota bacterium]MDW8201813.1 anti-sigma regulatory factor [Cyanobacteriota bacterium SKYGB_h_bin112]